MVVRPNPKQTPGRRGATSHPTALNAAPAVSFVGMIRSGSKGRAAERTAISVLRGGHPYRQAAHKADRPPEQAESLSTPRT